MTVKAVMKLLQVCPLVTCGVCHDDVSYRCQGWLTCFIGEGGGVKCHSGGKRCHSGMSYMFQDGQHTLWWSELQIPW